MKLSITKGNRSGEVISSFPENLYIMNRKTPRQFVLVNMHKYCTTAFCVWGNKRTALKTQI